METTENTQGTGTNETSFRQFYFIFCFATVVKKKSIIITIKKPENRLKTNNNKLSFRQEA